MSGAGLPPNLATILALTRPDLAAQQQAIGQQQQFGGGLLQQEPQYTPGGVVGWGGAANTLGSKLLGAIMLRNANKQQLDLANQYRAAMFPQQGQMQAQSQANIDPRAEGTPIQQSAATPLSSMPPNMAPQPNVVSQRPLPPLGSLPPGGLQAPPAPVASGPTSAHPAPQQAAQSQPLAPQGPQGQQSIFDEFPDVPGLTPTQKAIWIATDAPGYMKAAAANLSPTDMEKQAAAAYGRGTPEYEAAIKGIVAKAGAIDLRAEGSALVPNSNAPGGYSRFYGPNENLNEQFVEDPNNPGQMIARPIQGGAAAAAAFRGQVKGAEEENTVKDVTLPNGKIVPMYLGNAIGAAPANTSQPQAAQPPLGIRSNNPGNLQPGGQESQFANPTAGVLAASSNLDNYAKNGINTLQGIISTWAPQYDKTGKQINDTPAYVADVSKQLGGIDPNRPLNLSDPNVKGAVLEAMFQHENGKVAAPAAGAQPNAAQPGKPPELGVSTAQGEVNKAAGLAAAASQKQTAITQGIMAAIQGMRAINNQVPDGALISPEDKAEIDIKTGGKLATGDAGALAQWEQLNSQGILNGIAALSSGGGLGRMDIPIIKQIVAGHGIPADTPKAERLRLLDTLETQFKNNLAFTQNTAANLNQPGAATNTPSVPMGTYNAGVNSPKKMRTYNPQTGRLE